MQDDKINFGREFQKKIHVTCDMGHMVGGEHFSKCQLPSSNGLEFRTS